MKDNQEIARDYTDWMVKTGGFARDMTLRDWYMGTVVQGLLTAGNEHVVEIASVITDAMLEERNK